MKLRLWQNYIKRHDSSARPSDTGSIVIDVYVKAKTSLNNPIFVLDPAVDFVKYNYCYLEDFKTYYYVDDIILSNTNIVELVCRVDALATARQYIINTTAFVKYSSLNYNKYLRDERIQPSSKITSSASNNSFASDIHAPSDTDHCYVLTTLNDEGVCSYFMSQADVINLGNFLINNADDIIGLLKQYFQDVKESVMKLQVVPWTVGALQRNGIIPANEGPVKIGGYSTTITAYKMDETSIYVANDFVSLPPLADDFTRVEPYSEAKIHIPLLGVHDLSLSELQDTNKLYFRYICNVVTGATTCILFKGDADINKAQLIASYDGNVNYELPLGYITSANPTGILTGSAGAASAAAALLAGGSGAVIAGGIGAAVASFGSYFTKSNSMIGAFGGNASGYDSNRLSVIVYRHELTDEPDNLRQLYGRPCGKVLNLNSLVGGFVQTSQFQLMAPFDDGITQEVNDMMDRGVFLQ